MAYKIEGKLETLLSSAVSDEAEIAEGLRELQIPKEVVLKELAKNKDELLKPGQALFQEYINKESQYKASHPFGINRGNPLWLILVLLVPIMLILFLITLFGPFPEPYKTWLQNYFFYILIGISIFALILLIVLFYRRYQEYENKGFSLSTQEKLIDNQILEYGVKPYLRLYINEKEIASLDTTLKNKVAPGLWAIMDTPFEVPTATKDKVERMVANLLGGSIGIAGPRGVGKSTLLSTVCHPDRNLFIDTPALTVLTSVPVKYDAKDFILHLYSLVCEKVIRVEGDGNPSIVRSQAKLARERIKTGFDGLLGQYFYFLLIASVIGIIGIGFSIFWANQIDTKGYSNYVSFFTILDNLLQPSELFKFSGLIFLIPVVFLIRQILIFYRKIITDLSTTLLGPRRKKQNETQEGMRELSILIVKEATIRLEAIRYQMSFSSGWSGGIKFPDSIQFIESSSDYSYSKTRNQLTLPEIVNDFRNFLSIVAGKYKLLIGIDELDKISNSETAQQFLNETKAIFGVRGCYYLISVSDNALSNFERRGIAFRDEFDTSFDDVLFLETPDIEYSQLLLRRRVIGMPLPIVYYCHVLSGGLPRDLIRVCREVFDTAQRRVGEVPLTFIAEENVLADLKSKIRAISIAATDNLIEPEASILFDSISRITTDYDNHKNWLDMANLLLNQLGELSGQGEINTQPKIRKLIQELASYLLFSATALQYFKQMGEHLAIQAPTKVEISMLEQLAKAKQLITSSPKYSRSVTCMFREQFNLEPKFSEPIWRPKPPKRVRSFQTS